MFVGISSNPGGGSKGKNIKTTQVSNRIKSLKARTTSGLFDSLFKKNFYLCLFRNLPGKVENVLFLTKVLDNYLETVWPENEQ